MKSKYTKMQSNGNDFLITEDIKLVSKTKELSDRIKNIGFDQLLFFKTKKYLYYRYLMPMVLKQIIV